ncbi:MAG: hydroxymethylglutaryl-CoA reductase [Planctomycetota bacterium]
MPTDHRRVARFLQRLQSQGDADQLGTRLAPTDESLSPRLSCATRITPETVTRRWRVLAEQHGAAHDAKHVLFDAATEAHAETFSRNIENFVGTAKMPLGVAGPLRVRGLFASGDYYVPMATTEAALVASCTRGAQLLGRAGGARAIVVNEGVGRAPAFAFETLTDAGRFVAWLTAQIDSVRGAAEATTRHGKLEDVRLSLQGSDVYVMFEFTTGEAAGQNMVTIATDAACRWIIKHSPVSPRHWFIESNLSGDKKPTARSMLGVRGRKVVAEAVIPGELIRSRLHTSVDDMLAYYRTSSLGAAMSGALGIQGHYANALAAVFIATGQDAACVGEAATGITRFEPRAGKGGPEDALYASVTLPNLIVGTVGGGTALPSAQACLSLLGLPDQDASSALAEVLGALVLAGELSIIGSLAAGDFAEAHRKLARGGPPCDEDVIPDALDAP